MQTEEFKRAVSPVTMTGQGTQPWEISYFKGVQEPIANRGALSGHSFLDAGHGQIPGYCLEMICVGFLAGANLENGNPDMLLLSHLQTHHIRPRSLLGDDAEENLITLCAGCHQQLHLRKSK